jgi:hypothetical protein
LPTRVTRSFRLEWRSCFNANGVSPAVMVSGDEPDGGVGL